MEKTFVVNETHQVPGALRDPAFWSAPDPVLLLNGRLPESELTRLRAMYAARLTELPNHLFLASSGSTQSAKLIAITRNAVLTAARAVNNHIGALSADRWVLALPVFHVSGLSILARAGLSHSAVEVYPQAWNARDFVNFCEARGGTLTSLVPTQIFDLVAQKISAPPQLRKVFVGGMALDAALMAQATALGWPLVRCYGMTESAAFFAIEDTRDAGYTPLPHVHLRWGDEQAIHIAGPALFTAYLVRGDDGRTQMVQPFDHDHYWATGDRGAVDAQGRFRLLGRADDLVKVLGEKVSVNDLRTRLQTWLGSQNQPTTVEIFALPEARRGRELVVAVEAPFNEIQNWSRCLHEFNHELAPFERLQSFFVLEKFPRSPLGKILSTELRSYAEAQDLSGATRQVQRHPLS